MNDQTLTNLEARGVPRPRAEQKAASLARGIALLALGMFLMLMAAALVGFPMVVLGEMPGIAFLVFAGIFGGIGAVLLFAGGHIMSGEAVEAAAATGSVLAKAVARTVKIARGAGGNGP